MCVCGGGGGGDQTPIPETLKVVREVDQWSGTLSLHFVRSTQILTRPFDLGTATMGVTAQCDL